MLDLGRRESDIATMRRLLLLRHSKTERAEPGQRDRDRALTGRGRADAPLIGAYMARHRFVPDLAIVSPATRAQETWDLVAPCFAKPPRVITDDRVYNATPTTLMGVIGEAGDAASVMVVGHNPTLHDLAVQLIASGDATARERIGESLPTSGLVVIDLTIDAWPLLRPQSGRLACFVSPRLIAAATE
jgi:phosphohistidine phosphatase